jgi:N-acetyltransferase
MASRRPRPVVLDGRHIRLEPLTLNHVPDLHLVGSNDDAVWQWLPALTPSNVTDMRNLVEQRLAQQAAGEAGLFAIVPLSTHRPAGWIAYLDISTGDERLDIGWAWIARPLWHTPAGTEAHLLLLYNAFDTLGFGRVQWQVDHLDLRTQEILNRIGCILEGRLRRHTRRLDGTWRDTLVYSLLAPEWPAVKERVRSGWLP